LFLFLFWSLRHAQSHTGRTGGPILTICMPYDVFPVPLHLQNSIANYLGTAALPPLTADNGLTRCVC